MVYRGPVRNGKIEVDNGALLPEGAEVDITLKEAPAMPVGGESIPTLYDQLEDLIGSVPGLPDDFSVNHDHYLYGVARRE